MSKGRQGVPIDQLGDAYIDSMELPELPDLEGITADEAVAEKIRQGATQIREWTTSALVKLEEAKGMSREALERVAKKVTATQEKLHEFLNHETPAYRRACWMALLTHRLSRPFDSRAELVALLAELVSEGRLEELPENDSQERALTAYGKAYSVSDDSAFGKPEMAEIEKLWRQTLGRAWEAEQKVRAEQSEYLFGQSKLSLEDFQAGKPGKIALGIPPEQYQKNGETRWRSGGVLLIEVKDGFIHPLAATGGLQAPIKEAKKLNIRLKVESLTWGMAPYIKTLDEERRKKTQLLWFLIQRGVRVAKEAAKLQAVKEEMAAKAGISSEQFFLELEPGKCLVEFKGVWGVLDENREVTNHIPNIFFLIERFVQEEEGEEKRFVRLVEVPAHLNEYLAQCQGEYPEGEKFGGVPYPLVALLQAIFGQVTKSVQISNHNHQ